MLKNKKKILTIAGIVMAIIAIALIWTWSRERGATDTSAPIIENTLFPTGELLPGNEFVTNIASSSTSTEGETSLSDTTGRFYRVSSRPVGGLVSLGQATSSSLIYVEKATGHLYRLQPGTTAERISNTTIPKVYSLWGSQSGTSTTLVLRYLRDSQTQTFLGNIDLSLNTAGDDFLTTSPSTELPPLDSKPWIADILSLVVSPAQDKLLWLEPSGNESIAYLSDTDGDEKETLFRSPYAEWQLSWASSTTIALQSRTSALANGSLYFWDLRAKQLQPVITGVLGLSTLVSPDLSRVLYSGIGEQGLVFGIYNRADKLFGRFEIRTWAEKCVWSRDGITAYCAVPTNLPNGYRYPDDWYRGEVRLSDNIWKINAENGQNEIIFSPTTSNLGLNLDAERLILDANETTLYLINRDDQRLWALILGETLGSDD